jgi:hypothetical protein
MPRSPLTDLHPRAKAVRGTQKTTDQKIWTAYRRPFSLAREAGGRHHPQQVKGVVRPTDEASRPPGSGVARVGAGKEALLH